MFELLCQQTPLYQRTHGVPLDAVGVDFTYAKNCVQRLQQDEFEEVKRVLRSTFACFNPPAGSLMSWSLAAERAGFVVGAVFTARGGRSGRGELTIEPLSFPRGVFKSP